MAGLIASIAAARNGARVLLMHDRPVLGGNASSEIRMWIRGAAGKENRETGILQEIEMENIYRNPTMNYSVWDSVLYQMVTQEKNITLLLNCSCLSCEMDGEKIASVIGWQLNSYTFHTVKARCLWIVPVTVFWLISPALHTVLAVKDRRSLMSTGRRRARIAVPWALLC